MDNISISYWTFCFIGLLRIYSLFAFWLASGRVKMRHNKKENTPRYFSPNRVIWYRYMHQSPTYKPVKPLIRILGYIYPRTNAVAPMTSTTCNKSKSCRALFTDRVYTHNFLLDISTKHFTKPNSLDKNYIKRGNLHKHNYNNDVLKVPHIFDFWWPKKQLKDY